MPHSFARRAEQLCEARCSEYTFGLNLAWLKRIKKLFTMSKYAILRAEKLKTFGNIGASLSHNYRDRPTPNADPKRAHLNRHSVADSSQVMERIRERLPEKRRSDAVLAIEYLIASSPDAINTKDGHMAYFRDALAWLKERHGAENVIASSLHFDESTPHLVAYVVPLDGSGKLNAKQFLGGRKVLSEMQTDFAKRVGKKHDLERGIERSTATHTSVKEWYGTMNAAVRPIEIPPAALAPKVKEKRVLRPDVVETPEEVAKRLNKGLNRLLAPTVARAKMSDLDKKKADEIRDLVTHTQRQLADAEERARQAEANAAGLRQVYEALTPAEQKNLVQQAKRNIKIRDRCQQLVAGVYDQAAAPVRRFVAKAKQALGAVKGRWWDVVWGDVERGYLEAERPLSGLKTATQVLFEHSPGQANASKAKATEAIEAAARQDVDQAIERAPLAAPAEPGPTGPKWSRPKG